MCISALRWDVVKRDHQGVGHSDKGYAFKEM